LTGTACNLAKLSSIARLTLPVGGFEGVSTW
jgi:hypothetical protein